MGRGLTSLPELVVAHVLSFCSSVDLLLGVERVCTSPLLHRDLTTLRLSAREL